MVDDHYIDALPPGYRIREYEIRRVLGRGGFGITYLAHDTLLDRDVAIKEYLPTDYAVRTEDHSVRPRSSGTSKDYTWGLERFLDEARMMARLDHPSIVGVHAYVVLNGTGYIVMEYIEGEPLDDRLKRQGKLEPFDFRFRLTAILKRLVGGLEQVHNEGYLHRDITPRNIMLKDDGTPVLIDFGSARQMVAARSRSVTAVVTPGYAPLEQSSTHGKQGPWTDIYALSAVAYRCITGNAPIDATERVQGDALALGRCPRCGFGQVFEGNWQYRCKKSTGWDRPCRFRASKVILGQPLERQQMAKLLAEGSTDLLKDFVVPRFGRRFAACLVLNDDGRVTFKFPPREK